MCRNVEKFMRVSAVFLGILFAGAVFCPENSGAAERSGRPVRVAYIEGGFYTDYAQILVALAQGLAGLGIIADGNAPLPEHVESTAEIWQWLCANAGGNTIRFVPDGYYSAGWDDAVFVEKRAELIARLNGVRDIDLVLAFGTKAGQAMAADDHNTPVAVLSVTDAVTAGIIPSPEDSGRDHVFAMVEYNRYYRQVGIFHDIFRFKRLGIAYEDTEEGRGSIALTQIQKAAADSDFDLLTCVDTLYYDNPAPAVENLIGCHKRLAAAGADAVYMTVNNGMQTENMGEILRPLLEKRLPTFSQNGVDEVRHGVLMSISQANFSGQGLFAARAVANIVKGESPRSQKQDYEEPMSLAVNLRTAMLIGWNPSLAVLSAVDEIFQGQE
ncbi:MAG: ABC transporter substrate-binding protein [Desulfovibrio sp.]|jgi:ABC-type uncharacterized transport system substrate-binding protein|nr:ABC transporter substrate-binding protein [Desulfovibrio sp.]